MWTFPIVGTSWVIERLYGALLTLTQSANWTQDGTATPDDAAAYFSEAFAFMNPLALVGTILPFAGNLGSLPKFALACDGATYARIDYPALYAVLDPAYQLDADHFETPDLRGRTVIGAGSGTGLSAHGVGERFGEEQHRLIVSEMPRHTHSDSGAIGGVINGGVEAPASAAQPLPTTTGIAGGDGSHNNMQPSHVLNYIIVAQ